MSDASETGPGEEVRGYGDSEVEEEVEELEEDEQYEDEEAEDEEEEEEEEDEDVLSPDELADMCAKCGGRCCKYYTVMLDEPDDADDFDELRWFLAHEGCYIYVDDGEWHLNIESRCRFLDEKGFCTMYDHRPDVCREFGREEECEFTGEFDFEHMFNTIRELEAYAKKVLSPEELEKLPHFPERYDGPA